MLRYKIYVLFLFLFGVYGLNVVSAKNNDLPLLGKVIYLDAGHGGIDSGASYRDVYEKDINLEISLELEKQLSEQGAIVYQTRYGDYDLSLPNTINRKRSDLSRRSNIINNSKCDLFISIHLNAEGTGIWNGPQVFYHTNNEKNEKIAKIIQKQLNIDLKGDRKFKNDNTLYLQKRIKQPGVLVEVGFISNNNDRYLLKQKWYQKKVSASIIKAINHYFN